MSRRNGLCIELAGNLTPTGAGQVSGHDPVDDVGPSARNTFGKHFRVLPATTRLRAPVSAGTSCRADRVDVDPRPILDLADTLARWYVGCEYEEPVAHLERVAHGAVPSCRKAR